MQRVQRARSFARTAHYLAAHPYHLSILALVGASALLAPPSWCAWVIALDLLALPLVALHPRVAAAAEREARESRRDASRARRERSAARMPLARRTELEELERDTAAARRAAAVVSERLDAAIDDLFALDAMLDAYADRAATLRAGGEPAVTIADVRALLAERAVVADPAIRAVIDRTLHAALATLRCETRWRVEEDRRRRELDAIAATSRLACAAIASLRAHVPLADVGTLVDDVAARASALAELDRELRSPGVVSCDTSRGTTRFTAS